MNNRICKWYNNSDSPVLFMIDDLANTWVDTNKNGIIDAGEDWGYNKYNSNSSVKYLEDNILSKYEELKVTFFVPVGKRVGMLLKSEFAMHSKPINSDKKSKEFFFGLHNDKRYELAYHGTTHGKAGNTSSEFKQEWETFDNQETAIKTVKEGIDIFNDAIKERPLGGKYCGYTSNEFSDGSIDENEFLWWCRFCNLGTENEFKNNRLDKFVYGEDPNPVTNYDIKYFGKNNVIDIPTTVNGGELSSLYNFDKFGIKTILKLILRPYLVKKRLKILDYLIENKLVISVQEHISPARDDGKIQTPNIFTDKESLIKIFSKLRNKNIWYCTGSELAAYVYYRDNIDIKFEKDKIILNNEKLNKYQFNNLTLYIENYKTIEQPDGRVIPIVNNIVNIEIIAGEYKLY
ncbi:hypothetical protein SAMN02745163_03322 [Clostridium cavendishii DSM 21758]|uniref:Uncharacterized protein n=1 Tax=Clostridium cavendishii DSM 21758 TaxID=1121302 RepID=A0A1M6Q8X7_9CLOT|nr:hypothetical protein [Clostridium cavendishii]SHK16585.1 hypothetical protein SAMN02745163_03322 [Clostridium cavendishii DSM 21758]